MVDLCQREPSCFWNYAPGPDGRQEADEGEAEEGGRDAQDQAEVWHHLGGQCQCLGGKLLAMGRIEILLSNLD